VLSGQHETVAAGIYAGQDQMKAILLSAGMGKRLRPLTYSFPKALAPLNGRPLLDYWLEICEAGGISEVLINGHYLADQIEAFVRHARPRYRMDIHFVYEKRLFGTGGTVKRCKNFVADDDVFFFCHSDNFTNIDLKHFIEFHRKRDTELSVALFRTSMPNQCGIAEAMDDDGLITEFTEKPLNPKTNLASAAMFLMSPSVIDRYFPEREHIDFSRDILPGMAGNMYGYLFEGFNIDIGTLQNYESANRMAFKWPDIKETEIHPL